ncbi:MAG: hypothetical protein Q9M91_05870 [Candidatus Dojkabacteria bacterium]|nr:hypothetical protein [Candidatus Dojkabacteria bacterium]
MSEPKLPDGLGDEDSQPNEITANVFNFEMDEDDPHYQTFELLKGVISLARDKALVQRERGSAIFEWNIRDIFTDVQGVVRSLDDLIGTKAMDFPGFIDTNLGIVTEDIIFTTKERSPKRPISKV